MEEKLRGAQLLDGCVRRKARRDEGPSKDEEQLNQRQLRCWWLDLVFWAVDRCKGWLSISVNGGVCSQGDADGVFGTRECATVKVGGLTGSVAKGVFSK